jgi:NAD(P)-dependent dehydrogenase (short-subunit alcohol dehydrogenase family)
MTEDGIAALLVAAMAERTGYGPEVLGLDLDLESELAIDTVKQADVIHKVCERLGASTPADLRFGEIRTLREVARYLLQRASRAGATSTQAIAAAPRPRAWRADRFVLRAEPSPLAASAGGRFEFAGKHVVVTVDPYGIAGRVSALLSTQGARVTLVYPEDGGHARADDAFAVDMASPEQLRALVAHLRAHVAPVHGVYHLHALAPAIPFAEIGQAAWERAVEQATTATMAMAQALYGDFEAARPGETFFVVATQMGGCLGVATETPGDPVCGGHAGFLKSLRRELPGTLAKVVDFDSLYPVEQIARRLVDEVASLNAQVECGYVAGVRHVVSLHRSARAAGQAPLAVGPDWVFLNSGGGRGVVFETALGLAQQFGCTIYVTGRTPLPRPGSPWLSLTREALAASRNQFFAEQRAPRPQITPRELRSAWDAVLREWELHNNLQRAAAVSSRFHYRVCDVVSASDVRALVEEIRARHGRIDAVVHGAMVEESKSLPQKTDALIRRTIATKVHGAFHLMRATLADRPRLFMNFGSGAGRFGNKGQTDYAAAGDLLVKMTQVYHRTMAPDTRCITIDWPAWSGAGWVANNPNIEELLRDNPLATFIDVDEGVAWFVDEMLQGGDAGEVIVAGAGMAEGLGRTLQIADFFEAHGALGGTGSAAGAGGRERGAAAGEERRWDTV